ncbi:MAG: hypothetical protein DSY30_03435 [Alphaproteobacteria bacterium]|nr:MAG: hypothetical protein DSY30_03435 [Alphaproteobacteria bacterium]
MNDGLKPNQEKRIIENCVESIMDDLDVYHFDEKLMNKYEKQLIEFFTKISEEHSLFSPGFDFSNKKNIVNDKEKTKEVLELLNKLIENNEKKGSEWRRSENSLVSIIYTDQIKELEGIKKILEK